MNKFADVLHNVSFVQMKNEHQPQQQQAHQPRLEWIATRTRYRNHAISNYTAWLADMLYIQFDCVHVLAEYTHSRRMSTDRARAEAHIFSHIQWAEANNKQLNLRLTWVSLSCTCTPCVQPEILMSEGRGEMEGAEITANLNV